MKHVGTASGIARTTYNAPPLLDGMDDSYTDEKRRDEFEYWLNFQSRCFGDKGDVEDITEGQKGSWCHRIWH